MTFDQLAYCLRSCQQDLTAIEAKTRHGLFGSYSPSDYRELIQQLGTHQAQSHATFGAIQLASLSAQFLRRKLDHLNQVPQEKYRKKLEPLYDMLKERMDFLLSILEHAHLFRGMRERRELQQNVVSKPTILFFSAESLGPILTSKNSSST